MSNFAHLKASCPFFQIFPHGLVPIRNVLLPNKAECIGDGIQEVYMVDLEALAPGQLDRILDLMTGSCPQLRNEANTEIARLGLPLRAKHVYGVSTDSRDFL